MQKRSLQQHEESQQCSSNILHFNCKRQKNNNYERRQTSKTTIFKNTKMLKFPLFYSLLSFFILIRPGNSCMPGYENERARLRQYLGIEWRPRGLERMDEEQQARFLRHSSDLNCDFSNPDKCRWRNLRKPGFDTLDFHLFRKEDYTEFPASEK
uniref:Uncharacterized protein n=1 Tax=Meloidogyne enterolobii TaxID=390850 RepID=A0A6V7VJ83_MELEN|nr:unnamed protein product [Meloidogyne enterolobii]